MSEKDPSRDQGVFTWVAVARIVPREVDGTAATTERFLVFVFGTSHAKFLARPSKPSIVGRYAIDFGHHGDSAFLCRPERPRLKIRGPQSNIFVGCGDPYSPSQTASSANGPSAAPTLPAQSTSLNANAVTVRFSDVLASWESGKSDEAVKKLVSIRWGEPAVFADLPVLSLSEDGFKSLTADDRGRMQQESMKLATTFRDLAKHALSVGDNAQSSGDRETAKTHYEAVRQFGEALSSPERLLMIQLVGKAVARLGQDKGSAVD